MKDLEFVSENGSHLRLLPEDNSGIRGMYLTWHSPSPANWWGGGTNSPKLRQFLRRALVRLEKDARRKKAK